MTDGPSIDSQPRQNAPAAAGSRPPIRWWPAVVIALLAIAFLVWARTAFGRNRQDQNIAIAQILIISGLLLLIWCLFFSRLRRKLRWAILGVVVLCVGLMPLLFRIHGVTGDLLPILEWRWARKSMPRLQASSPSSARDNPAHATLLTNDYPQFLGPNRDAILEGPRLARDWKVQPPERLWLVLVGAGWSGFAVAGHRAITQEQRGEEEVVSCYDLLTGSVLWAYSYNAHYQSSLAGEGPRATPTIAEQRVYTLGSTGILNCLDLVTGKLVWTKDIVRDNQGRVSEWGMSCSPLVTDELVIVSAGGHNERSLVAYRAQTGEFVWGAGNNGSGYSSPCLATISGVRQVIIFNDGGVRAHSLADGKILWKYPWPGGHPHVSMPILLPNDRVLVSSGYGIGSELLQIKKDAEGNFAVDRLWKSNRLKAKFANLVYRDGFVYGLDDGIMVCLDAATGEQKWKEGRYGHGQQILVGDLLLVSAESGEIILLEPNPNESRELCRFSALEHKTWNPPALVGEYLLVRNDKEAACYRLSVIK